LDHGRSVAGRNVNKQENDRHRESRHQGEKEMSLSKLHAFGCAAILGFALALNPAAAQTFPDKPVRFIVPYPPGGAVDTVGRVVAAGLSKAWNQPVVVENKPGAGSNLGAEFVSHAKPDGYTIMIASDPAMTMNMFVHDKLPFDPEKDFTPIVHLINVHSALAVPATMPVNSVKEFAEYMKKNGDKLNYGSPGIGDSSHIGMEWLKAETGGFPMQHLPYAGMGPAVQGLVSGDHQGLIVSIVTIQQHVESGKVKLLAVSGPKRAPSMPNLPTFTEAGFPNVTLGFFLGLVGPAGMPPEVTKKIYETAKAVLESPDFKGRFVDQLGYEVVASSPAEFTEFMKKDRVLAKRKVDLAGLGKK
jgi:tripartite-type tricarboxylate transporter receptor subunit TctC